MTDPTPPNLAALATVLDLAMARTVVTREVDAALGDHHGLGLDDLDLLLHLRAAGGSMTRADLAAALGIAVSGAARRLGPLERIGVVTTESGPGGARLAVVALTPAGAELAGNGEATAVRAAAHALDNRWSRPEQAALGELVARVRHRR